MIFFSNEIEAETFIKLVNEILSKNGKKKVKKEEISEFDDKPQKFYTKEQVKELLVQMVSSDKFVDQFYQLL